MTIAEIRARHSAATPGPWEALTNVPQFLVREADNDSGEADVCEPYMPNDAIFIAHAPTDIAALLKIAEAAQARHVPLLTKGFSTGDPDYLVCANTTLRIEHCNVCTALKEANT